MFDGQVALVTGGASGIGRALCERLAAHGAKVAAADLDAAAATAVAAAIGGDARGYGCDVADREQVQALAASVAADYGNIDLVFANAGVAVGGGLVDADPTEFRWLFDVNVGGVFHTVQAFVPLLRQAADRGRRPRFIITGSENSLGVPPSGASSIYTATKHALLGLADCLRRDLADTGVNVSIFCPGLVATNVWDARRHRQDGYGGARAMPAEVAERAAKAMQERGMAPELTVTLALEGVARGDFLVVTDTRIRTFAEPRLCEIAVALDLADARLAHEGDE